MFRKLCCFCRIKGKKSESNSQHTKMKEQQSNCCFCRIKGKKSESNSQPHVIWILVFAVVSAVSKVRNLKAIHNLLGTIGFRLGVVSAVSKVRNLKAIHNHTTVV